MIPEKYNKYFNRYYGKKWINASLPTEPQVWMMGPYELSVKKDSEIINNIACDIKAHLESDSWVWPDKTVYFFSDMHADADAFIASLVASGGIKKTGPKDKQFKLTAEGKKARFILGGDCFDKGPSTLRLLRVIKLLIDKGGDVVILAGNHDTRTLVGILSLAMKPSPATEHFFVRMGLKPLPLFKEIYHTYLTGKQGKHFKTPDTKECRKRLFPSKEWVTQFPDIAKQQLSRSALQKEMKKTTEKINSFEKWCSKEGITLKQVYAAVKKWQKLFLHPKGEFYWFFKHLELACKEGSFFFVHAGVDNLSAKMIRNHGIKWINKKFRKKLRSDQFNLYYGPLGNMIRTKYRDCDRNFTKKGALMMYNAGINAIVHGHRNLYYGQRMMLRKGVINFECDTSLDINTRKKEGVVRGPGASVTIIHPQKLILGISSDYPYIKVFEPELTLRLCNLQ
ncbi:MAG: metallophosphoesterase family protein [Gammaproteobacteria bacterium]|nr:metallophosphoesterase family protein [Gammaproteobacteria bacterium]